MYTHHYTVMMNDGFLPLRLKNYVAAETNENALALEKYFKTCLGNLVSYVNIRPEGTHLSKHWFYVFRRF